MLDATVAKMVSCPDDPQPIFSVFRPTGRSPASPFLFVNRACLGGSFVPCFFNLFRAAAGLDAALIHSTIDGIPSPNSLLARMGGARGIVRENGGLVVVVSAYEWNEEVTPVGAWLGGYLDEAGNQVGTTNARSLLQAPIIKKAGPFRSSYIQLEWARKDRPTRGTLVRAVVFDAADENIRASLLQRLLEGAVLCCKRWRC